MARPGPREGACLFATDPLGRVCTAYRPSDLHAFLEAGNFGGVVAIVRGAAAVTESLFPLGEDAAATTAMPRQSIV
jgi:hypothetical protein